MSHGFIGRHETTVGSEIACLLPMGGGQCDLRADPLAIAFHPFQFDQQTLAFARGVFKKRDGCLQMGDQDVQIAIPIQITHRGSKTGLQAVDAPWAATQSEAQVTLVFKQEISLLVNGILHPLGIALFTHGVQQIAMKKVTSHAIGDEQIHIAIQVEVPEFG